MYILSINAMNMHKHNNCHPLHHHYVERVGLVISQGPLPWRCLLYNLQGLGPQPWYLLHTPMCGWPSHATYPQGFPAPCIGQFTRATTHDALLTPNPLHYLTYKEQYRPMPLIIPDRMHVPLP